MDTWKKGWPKGTRVIMQGETLKEELRGKEAVIFTERTFNEECDTWVYEVFHEGRKYCLFEYWVTFKAFHVKDQTWARNKIHLLISDVSPTVAFDLGQERQRGELP